jgi:hypothetical protein
MNVASQHAREQLGNFRRGHYFYVVVAIATIAVSTTLGLILIQLIAAAR